MRALTDPNGRYITTNEMFEIKTPTFIYVAVRTMDDKGVLFRTLEKGEMHSEYKTRLYWLTDEDGNTVMLLKIAEEDSFKEAKKKAISYKNLVTATLNKKEIRNR